MTIINEEFLVPIYSTSTGYDPIHPELNIIGYAPATYLRDQFDNYVLASATGKLYIVPAGYDPLNTINKFSHLNQQIVYCGNPNAPASSIVTPLVFRLDDGLRVR